jgi:hypothetical protein
MDKPEAWLQDIRRRWRPLRPDFDYFRWFGPRPEAFIAQTLAKRNVSGRLLNTLSTLPPVLHAQRLGAALRVRDAAMFVTICAGCILPRLPSLRSRGWYEFRVAARRCTHYAEPRTQTSQLASLI